MTLNEKTAPLAALAPPGPSLTRRETGPPPGFALSAETALSRWSRRLENDEQRRSPEQDAKLELTNSERRATTKRERNKSRRLGFLRDLGY